jgi:methylmalonyl-CoA mutase N-terminal domain/subunit
MALGEVGRTGVAIDTLKDMERLFDQIDLGKVSTSMTINATSAILLAMYQAVGAKQGVSPKLLSGTIQNDILKEYEARNTYIFPPKGSMRLITDIFQYCSSEMPTAVQELAFTFANAIEYVRAAMSAGLEVDTFAPQLSFFFVAQMNLFEEIAKFRAARRIWARIMKEQFNAQNPKSMNLRFHVQTAGSSLTLQQPDNNIVRTTIEALAAALGGCQSLHTNSKDEAIALPTEASALVALRTQQIIAFESGVTNVADPVGGSYYIESLTDKIECDVLDYLAKIEAMGGAIKAVEAGFIQKEIQDSAYEDHQEKDSKRRLVVGVNSFIDAESEQIQVQRIDPALEPRQVESLRKIKAERDQQAVEQALASLHQAAAGSANLIPYICEAVQCYATVGEISNTLKRSFGKFRPLVTI